MSGGGGGCKKKAKGRKRRVSEPRGPRKDWKYCFSRRVRVRCRCAAREPAPALARAPSTWHTRRWPARRGRTALGARGSTARTPAACSTRIEGPAPIPTPSPSLLSPRRSTSRRRASGSRRRYRRRRRLLRGSRTRNSARRGRTDRPQTRSGSCDLTDPHHARWEVQIRPAI